MDECFSRLLSEEIPARMQGTRGRPISNGSSATAEGDRFGVRRAPRAFVTPRRLALVVEGMADGCAPNGSEERRGPERLRGARACRGPEGAQGCLARPGGKEARHRQGDLVRRDP